MLAGGHENQNLSYMHDLLMPVMEYLYPSYSATAAKLREFATYSNDHQPEISSRLRQQNYENLQLTVTLMITNLRFLVDYSCQDYKFMLAVTWKHVDCDEKEGWSGIK